MIVGFQLAGALGRVGSGMWSDQVGSRLRPMRQLAVASAMVMAALSIGAALDSGFVVVAFGVGAVITVADNGLAYTAVAETAGTEWSGQALGVQNTVQNVMALATAPALALVIGATDYPIAFAVAGPVALLAVPLIPSPRQSKRAG